MKFVTRKGAPDIPIELLEARDDDRLVFFCGAGISRKAGLDEFRGLVDKVYASLGESIDRHEGERKAYKEKYYDRVLELLENRYYSKDRAEKFLVRKKIIDNLTIHSSGDLSTHKAILELCKTKNGKFRLVTTNVDRGFLLANPGLEQFVDTAPKLRFPKPHKWYSLVHLHGLIDNQIDPNGENFVFTSGDFGTAYLTERWASQFVGELFRNFIVLFVGYGINDPVIRYMTDAIAAERRKGDKGFHQPYVFAATSVFKRIKDRKEWEDRGVQPILYNAGKNHTYLHKTLVNWSAHCRDGMRAKERIIRMYSQFPPHPPFTDEQTKLVLETLQERSDGSSESLTGVPARIFAETDDPVPHVDWLPALDDRGLLNQCLISKQCYPVDPSPRLANLVHANKMTTWLWYWLAKHLEEKKLINWVIDRGVCLHPDLADIVKRKLSSSNSPTEPYFTFWKIVTSDQAKCEFSYSYESLDLLDLLRENVSDIDLYRLLSLLQPKIRFSKPIRGLEDDDTEVYDAAVVLAIDDDHFFDEVQNLSNYPELLAPVLTDLTLNLIKAMSFHHVTGQATHEHDRSHWDMPSIAPHAQNHRFEKWVYLIEFCRDAWQAAWQLDQKLALSTLELWKVQNFPLFKRLVFHAYTVEDVVSTSDALESLLEKDGWWLWLVDTKREKYRLLNKIWPLLDEPDAEQLVNAIIEGPPKEMYVQDLSDSEWHEIRNKDKWELLSKLTTFGRPLNGAGQAEL